MDVRVIDETTAEFRLDGACPTCEGPLTLRVSADGAWTFCSECHVIGHPKVFRDAEKGLALQFDAGAN